MSRFLFVNTGILSAFWSIAAAAACVSLAAEAQTFTNGVPKYASLTGATVTVSNRCELWVTNSAPLSGCTINLNSVDAWLFLPGVKPSVVVSTYLSQIKITNGTAAADSNCRVVQYGQNGAVVIPQSSSFQPLTVYTGAGFSGAANSYSQWTYYTGTTYTNISSFKLKRGYQAVIAQSSDGKNYSKCYVAQDGDLEVGVLPATLSGQVQFIYVTPWRWISKKGIGGNPPYSDLNVNWWYDWNIDQSSARDLEYTAIWQRANWPSLSQSWQSSGINTVLGYNEPDNSSPASPSAYTDLTPAGSVTNAVARYPAQVATGLRVGSPATTDGGVSSWLIPFVQQADAAGYRVDFVAQHYYQGHSASDSAGCASQMYNFLLNIWNNTHRPIWVTEWNNGANWTDGSYAAPTYAQQQADIQAMVSMLESTPFVERYALFNWVEDTRSLVTSSNTVTLAGTVYSNTVSALGYSQAMPNNGTRGVAEYLFANNTWDNSGYYNNAMAVGAPNYTAGHNSQSTAVALDGTNSYLQLPVNVATNSGFTFAAWVYWNGGASWQRIFDFGAVSTTQGGTPTSYMFLSPSSSGGNLRFAITVSGSSYEQQLSTTAMTAGTWTHVAVTLSNNTAVLYVNGSAAVSSTSFTNTPARVAPVKNYLGKSQFSSPNSGSDPLFNGKLDQVEIADYAMSAAQIAALAASAQVPALTGGAWTNNASGNWSDTNNWNNGWIPNGPTFIADFGGLDITANRTVTLDTARTNGGLRFGDLSGAQSWTLAGANTLTLDGGTGYVPQIAVNQNTATISAPLAGTNGLAKTGAGTLALSGTNSLGGSLLVSAGTVNLTNGSLTLTGASATSIGYETGTGTMSITGGGTFTALENVWVGGSDLSGATFNATGNLNITNSTAYFGGSAAYSGPHYADGSLAIGAGNNSQNSVSGTMTVNGGTIWCTNDLIIGFAGTGTGRLNILSNGVVNVGPLATKWLSLGKWDTSCGIITNSGGYLNLMNNTSIKFSSGVGSASGGGGTNTITQNGGTNTFYSDAGVTIGGTGSLDLSQSGSSTANNTYNLNGGVLIVPQIVSVNTNGLRAFNFNGGTLKAAVAGANLLNLGSDAGAVANVRNIGAIIDDNGYAVTISQALVHSTIAGDNATDGGLTKTNTGTLTLSGANTYTGQTKVNAGTLLVNGALGASLVNVNSGGALGGNGVIGGVVNVHSGAVFSPGIGVGILTVSNNLNLQAGSKAFLEINRAASTNDQFVASGALFLAGTLVVTNLGGTFALGDSFTLFRAGSVSGNFASNSLPPLNAGLGWNTASLNRGILSVLSTVQTNVQWNVNSTGLTLAWPADHAGWRLLMCTNDLASTNWVAVPNSALTNQLLLPFDPTQGGVFYRLVYP